MDDLTVKPRDNASRAGPDRRAPVHTELAPAASVAASPASAPRGAAPGETGPHDFHLAPQSQTVIDREREISAGRRRASDQALLRMRAYGRPLRKDEDEPESQADLEA